LDSSGLLADILPEVAAMHGVEQPPEFHPEGDVWEHTLLLLEQLRHPTVTLAWGALLHDIGKPATFRVAERIRFDGHVEEGVRLAHSILSRLRFSREQIEQIESLVANHMRFKDVPHMKDSTLKRFLRLPEFAEYLELHRLDVMSSNRNLESYQIVKQKLVEFSEEQLKPARLLTGADLIAAGYTPGPRFTEILAVVEDAQLEGLIHTAGEAIEMVRERFPLEATGRPPCSSAS
jgi:poly(A) polymerase